MHLLMYACVCVCVFSLSFRVDSDILPERLEKQMHAYIKTRTSISAESLVTRAVKMYAKKDIYNNGNIDPEKLTKAMSTFRTIPCTTSTTKVFNLQFLSQEPYGVQVVAFLIYRYQSV